MLKRPKPSDDEDEILRMQEEYLNRKKKEGQNFEPAAKCVNLGPNLSAVPAKEVDDKKIRKSSKFAQARGLKDKSEKKVRFVEPSRNLVGDIVEKNSTLCSDKPNEIDDDKVYYPNLIPSVLGNIMEKNVSTTNNFTFTPMPAQGFPQVFKHDLKVECSGKSVFSMHMAILKRTKNIVDPISMEIDTPSLTSDIKESINSLNIPTKSYILNTPDADSIHHENVERLNKMSEEDILNEQKEILSNLNPDLIAYLKSKRNIKTDLSSGTESEAMDQNPIENTEDVDSDYLWDNEVLTHPHLKHWLHFDSLEKEKLIWMKNIKDANLKPDQPYEARFDFEGNILAYTAECTEKTKPLFHHGEEPHRPGYSLSELFELSRSTVIQQRVVAINTLGAIIQNHMSGMYYGLEIPLSKIFFVIRIALDENKPIILEPSLKAMRNMFYNFLDEIALDSLISFSVGIQQPCLKHEKSVINELDSKEQEFTDYHLAEIDLVTTALRTDIIQRILYIFGTVKPPYLCIEYALQILIRLSRDSVIAQKILDSDHLMELIVRNYIPVTNINCTFDQQKVYNRKPDIHALKLIRVLSSQSFGVCEDLVKKYNILLPLNQYITSEVVRTYGLKIQIEAFNILTNILYYGIEVEHISAILPYIINILRKHIYSTQLPTKGKIIIATHASVALQLLNKILVVNKIQFMNTKDVLYSLIRTCTEKWFSRLSKADFSQGDMLPLYPALECCKTLGQYDSSLIPIIANTLKSFSSSEGFKVLISQLNSSNILSGIEKDQIATNENLMCLGTSVIGNAPRVLKLITMETGTPLLLSLFKLLDFVNDSEVSKEYVCKMIEYLKDIIKCNPSLSDNWFTRMEMDLIFNIIKVSVNLVNLNELQRDVLYSVANKLCNILRRDKIYELNFLLENIVFNKNWFATDRLINLMSLSDNDFEVALMSLDNIKMCYGKVINLKLDNVRPDLVIKNWQEPILPRDWIYLPILNLYSKSQEIVTTPKVYGKHAEKVEMAKLAEKEFTVINSLEWIIFNELIFPDFLTDISITDRFCRIMCIFLCDNSLFLDAKIKKLLRSCIHILFTKEKKSGFNFEKPLIGLNNFQDFYTQFLEHFQSVSYGDFNFTACVFVPLAQKHNLKWRKLLWSEYAGCLRALDCPEEYLCYDLNEYYYPEETDGSLLKSYVRALNGNLLRPDTLAHKIASHHVQCFKKRSTHSQTTSS